MYEKNEIEMFIIIIIIVIGSIWIYQYINNDKPPQPVPIEGYVGINNGFPYAKLGGGYNSQLFSPCVSKRCAGGPYMYTSNPYLQAVCQGVSNEELAQVACGKAFHGRPVHFDYSSLSDGAWDNALCNTPSTSSLCVL